jgi:hypothetical protein
MILVIGAIKVETFLVTANGKEQQRIQAFDPSKPYPKQWTLLQQQYLPPNKAMLHEYNSIQQSSNQEHIPEELKNIEIIDLESITLVQETDLEYIFSFTPQLPMFEAEVNENFHGRLFFNKDKQLIEMLHLKTNSSFSPKLALTIDSYELTIRITQFENVLHVTYIESDKSGSFLFLQEFHEINKKSFSNFLKVNGQLPPQYE